MRRQLGSNSLWIKVAFVGVSAILGLLVGALLNARANAPSNLSTPAAETNATATLLLADLPTSTNAPLVAPIAPGTPVAAAPSLIPTSVALGPLLSPAPPATVTVVPAPFPAPSLTPDALATPLPARSLTPATPISQTVFRYVFDQGKLDTSKWTYENTRGSLLEWSHQTMRMYSGVTHAAYVHSSANPFPTSGDMQVTVHYRYFRQGPCRAAVGVGSFVVPAALPEDETHRRIQSGVENGGVSFWFYHDLVHAGSGIESHDIPIPEMGAAWHEIMVQYLSGAYTVRVDGTAVYQSAPTQARLQYIWFGYPAELVDRCEWDTLEVQDVRVDALNSR